MSKLAKGPHEDITYRVIGAAMAVHRRVGPGHKEAVYQRALEAEFEKVGLAFEAQKNLEVYDEGRLVGYYIPDFIVGERSLRYRRVFPSPQAAEFRVNHQWLFVPHWLKAELGLSV